MFARLFGVNLSHEFFNHLDEGTKQEIYSDNYKNKTVIYSFEKEEKIPVFAAVIDILDDRIHVREVGGQFVFNMQWCEKLCEMMAKKFNKEKISFCTNKKGVKTIGKRLGYTQSIYKNEFEKAVSYGR